MLSKEVFKSGIEKMIVVYPNWSIKADDSKVMATWYGFFKDMNDDHYKSMINKHINDVKFNPTIASLNECNKTERSTAHNEPTYY